ncbi:hypothetical protein [Salinispora arenicola]|uniref:hypothetical protein n=1 Tax=Salinispora arenicola TaxID=168697 RepID=UPI0016A61D8A|nr:hypothetical protein [Salinispora arenicola]NIL56460.1 hypothetical protein [Salinispora arenicola]NIL62834.1 hypothetical protein [Salinispora arenicola]
MPEHDNAPDLDDIFTAYTSGGPLAVPSGAAAAQHVARRRRTTRLVAAGVLAVAVLAAAPALASTWTDQDPPIPPAETPTPIPSTLSATPTATPSTGVPTPSASAPPEGRISKEQLGGATIDLPEWPAGQLACPSGRVRFSEGVAVHPADRDITIEVRQVAHSDLDRDGAQETAALLLCNGREWSKARVLAFDRTATGDIETMGLVVEQTDQAWPTSNSIAGIRSIRPAATAVEVEVADFGNNGVPLSLAQHQWRAYSWSGKGFVQSGGPTTFPPNPRITDLSISGDDVRLSPVGSNRAKGVIKLEVANLGPGQAPEPQVQVYLPRGTTAASLPKECTASDSGTEVTCQLAALTAKGSTTLEVPVSAQPSGLAPGSTIGEYAARVRSVETAGGGWFPTVGSDDDNVTTGDLIMLE